MDEFSQRLEQRTSGIGVVGLGYVGLPLAMAFARAGFRVVGVDVSEERVAQLRDGASPIMDVPSEQVARHVREERFCPSTDFSALRQTDVIFVCVPTPFDRAKAPDLSYILSAAQNIAAVLRDGQLIILESTTYPGTTESVLVPVLESTGKRAGVDFHLAFSPERIDPGNKRYTIENTSKVVGGIDPESTRRAALVLEQVVRDGSVHRVSSASAAELTKLLENIFRAVNIALVNELAMLCDRMGIDVWEVIEAASTKPYGFMPFYPGPGVGGHCVPVDPYYLAWRARQYDFHTKFIELAAETNIGMPFYTAGRIRRFLNESGKSLRGARILALGAAFKRDIDDARNSTAIRVIEILRSEGAVVEYHDPHVPQVAVAERLYADSGQPIRLRSVPLTSERLAAADCVVVLVAHSAVDYGAVVEGAALVFDAVNATQGVRGSGRVERL